MEEQKLGADPRKLDCQISRLRLKYKSGKSTNSDGTSKRWPYRVINIEHK